MYLKFSAPQFSGSDNMASWVCGYCNIEMHTALCMVRKYRMRIFSSYDCQNKQEVHT